MSLRYRPYKKGDEEQIIALFNEVFGSEFRQYRNPDQWVHDYIDNPLGPSVIYLAVDESARIVGHYALSRRVLEFKNRSIPAGLSLDTMVSPKYRGRGIFGKLARRAYSNAAENGIHLVYGFPNDNSKNYFFSKLKWQALPSLPFRAHPLKPRSLFDGSLGQIANAVWAPISNQILKADPSESSIRETDFNQEIPGTVPFFHCRRDSKFLNWRFADVADRTYLKYGYYNDNKLTGYIVGRAVEYGGLRGGAVVDLWPINGSPSVLRPLFNHLGRKFKEDGCDVIYSVLPEKTASTLGLGRMIQVPARYQVKTNWFGYRPLVENQCPLSELGRSECWAMTLADWDIA